MRHTPCGCAPYGVLLLNSKARISESKVLVLTVYYDGNKGWDRFMKITEQVWLLAQPLVEQNGCELWDVEYVR